MNFRAQFIYGVLGFALAFQPLTSAAAQRNRKLSISLDRENGTVIIMSERPSVLKRAVDMNHKFKSVPKRYRRANTYRLDASGTSGVYRLKGGAGSIYTVNVVGYVNLMLPPGLSLIANPLFYTNNTLAYWMPVAPDGSQVFKFTPGGGYEVSTFDAIAGGWSNPDLDVSIGTGFYFNNSSLDTLRLTFIGEVLQGELVNPLPAGISTKGSLVPQAGSMNTLHNIPGEPGDEIRIYANDGQGGGDYVVTTYTAAEGWVPELQLGVGQGFWIQKQHAQDWIRNFSVNN